MIRIIIKKIVSSLLNNIFLLIFYTFIYIPIIIIFIGSISSSENYFSYNTLTLDYYREIIHNDYIIRIFLSSVFISLVSVFLSLFFSLIGLYYIFFKGEKSNIFFLVYPIIFTSDVVFATSFLILFSSLSIPLNIVTLIIVHSVVGIGFSFPLLYQRWSEIDLQLISASYDLGASSLQTWKKIVIPYLKPTIISSFILNFIIAFDDYILTSFCGGNSVVTVPTFILSTLRTGITPQVKALSVLIMIFSFIIGILFIIYNYFSSYKRGESQ